ncbi:MAG TPA: class I SAM-dependent methyltransferase [Luteitalea sp.]|nr:class I SAM-dependent methyltransferase [Luteitalea sp.]
MITAYEIWLRLWARRAQYLRRSRTDVDGAVTTPLPGQPFVHGFHVTGWAVTPDDQPQVAVYAGGRKVWEGIADLPHPAVGPRARRFSTFIRASALEGLGRFPWVRVTARPSGTPERQAKLLHALPLQRGRLLSALPRWAYGRVWDRGARTELDARLSVAGFADQAEWDRSGDDTAARVARDTAISTNDHVLEVGCGAGRVGAYMAPRCGHWTGADVSQNMLNHARRALAAHANVGFVHLNGFDLAGIADASQDVVYCTAVFMHLDEWDRYRYVTEFFRVLKPGGRVYFDNFELRTPDGWRLFTEMAALDVAVRPPNVSRASTEQELSWYAIQAGFIDVGVDIGSLWVTVVGRKPA